jgi:hypothetical protein
MTFIDPGDQPRGKRRSPNKAPDVPSLFDISNNPPPTPFRVKSDTSIDAAKEIREETRAKRRNLVYQLVKGSPKGLARFQLSAALGCPEHWLTSSIDTLIVMRKVEYDKTRTIENPLSRKQCSIIVALESGEAEGAA